MPRVPSVSLPLPEPLALLDATLLFLLQLLLARHPELYAPPQAHQPAPSALHPARRILDAIREVHQALELYQAFCPEPPGASESDASYSADEDIPF